MPAYVHRWTPGGGANPYQAYLALADAFDGWAWEPYRYELAINAVEPLYRRLGRAFSGSARWRMPILAAISPSRIGPHCASSLFARPSACFT